MAELLSLPAVEGDPGRVAAVRGHRDLQLHPRRHHDWAEGEGVRTDGRHHDGGYGGVDHAGARRHGVGGTSSGGRHYQTITLQKSDECHHKIN